MAVGANGNKIRFRIHLIICMNFVNRDNVMYLYEILEGGSISLFRIKTTDGTLTPVLFQTSQSCLTIAFISIDQHLFANSAFFILSGNNLGHNIIISRGGCTVGVYVFNDLLDIVCRTFFFSVPQVSLSKTNRSTTCTRNLKDSFGGFQQCSVRAITHQIILTFFIYSTLSKDSGIFVPTHDY